MMTERTACERCGSEPGVECADTCPSKMHKMEMVEVRRPLSTDDAAAFRRRYLAAHRANRPTFMCPPERRDE